MSICSPPPGVDLGAPHPFTLQARRLQSSPAESSGTAVEVLRDGLSVCRFERNYWDEVPFAPFRIGESWYALYCPDYTATRVLRLDDGKDLGGEEGDSFGFCPVDFLVPAYRQLSWTYRERREDGRIERRTGSTLLWPNTPGMNAHLFASVNREVPETALNVGFAPVLSEWRFAPFALVSGCVWGDDSSWKVEFLDLSHAAEGVLVRSDRWGYAPLPATLSLQEAVDMRFWRPDGTGSVGLATMRYLDLATGEIE